MKVEVEDEVEDVETIAEAPATKAPAKAKAKVKAKAKPAVKAKPAAKPAVKAKGNGTHKAKGKARKPRTVDPAKLDPFGFRKGSMKSKAAAMYAGKKGATLGEVKDALDSTQFNLLTELEGKGFKITRTQVDGDNNRKVTKFQIVAK